MSNFSYFKSQHDFLQLATVEARPPAKRLPAWPVPRLPSLVPAQARQYSLDGVARPFFTWRLSIRDY